MTQFSWPWPDTSPQTGDGRKITSSEFAALLLYTFGAGVLPVLNELEVTTPGANQISVNTGYAIVKGKLFINDAALSLAPDSAGAGSTRQDSVILQSDWTGGGDTAQYTVRAIIKEGTSGSPPSLTQTENVLWEERLYSYTISDAGVISGITDARTLSHFETHVNAAMIDDDAITEDKILDGAVTEDKIGDLEITGDKIANLAIGAGKIAGLQITEGKIANDAVTADKLAHSIDATGIGFDADKVDGYDAADLLGGIVPVGAIIMWYGSLGGAGSKYPMVGGSPDTDWQLCDGTNGTPDMQGRFPLGAGGTFAAAKGDTGGRSEWNWSHPHSADGTLAAAATGTPGVGADVGGNFVAATTGHTHDVTGNTANAGSASESLMPPYRALYFLQKVA